MKSWRNRDYENGKPRRRLLVAEQRPLNLRNDHLHHPCPVSNPQQMPGVLLPVELKVMLHRPQSHTDLPEEAAAGATMSHPIDHLHLIVVLLERMTHLEMLPQVELNLPR